MTKYLLDTNIVLRFSNPSDKQHGLVTEAVAILLMRADECYLTAQVAIEFWVVATRPVDVNGLGWSVEQTRSVVDQLIERFPVVDESSQIFATWLTLVTENYIKGKRVHDVRLAAAMSVSSIRHILTLNPTDFAGIPSVVVVHPQGIVDSELE
ncbi:MAG: PIN domain-containing protein [Spirulinaceae cyanobacterium SM2_1_0]|nr:PIN domain-containing protein [Spirulinaceae cyanobacterium SM2_1_0]